MKSISTVLHDYKAEFNRITFPSSKDLLKQTYTVITVCLFFGIIIFGLDSAYGYCSNFLINLIK